MKAKISPPYVYRPASGQVPLTYEMRIEGSADPFEAYLEETPDGPVAPLQLSKHIPGVKTFLAGGERISLFPWHINADSPAGYYRMSFQISPYQMLHPAPFAVRAYSWPEPMFHDQNLMLGIAPWEVSYWGYGWYIGGRKGDQPEPSRAWIRTDFGSALCTALERTYWDHYYDEPIKIYELSGPGGQALDGHPSGSHAYGKAADGKYLLLLPDNPDSVDWRWYIKFIRNFAAVWVQNCTGYNDPGFEFTSYIDPAFWPHYAQQVAIMESGGEITRDEQNILLAKVHPYEHHRDHWHLDVPRP